MAFLAAEFLAAFLAGVFMPALGLAAFLAGDFLAASWQASSCLGLGSLFAACVCKVCVCTKISLIKAVHNFVPRFKKKNVTNTFLLQRFEILYKTAPSFPLMLQCKFSFVDNVVIYLYVLHRQLFPYRTCKAHCSMVRSNLRCWRIVVSITA